MTKTITRYENAVWGSATSPWTRETHFVVAPSVLRLTEGRRLEIAKTLYLSLGKECTEEKWNAVSSVQRLSWSIMHIGKYEYVEITEYDDGTFGYTNNGGGGGNYPTANLTVVEV